MSYLAVSSWKGGLDGRSMMLTNDTAKDVGTFAGAWAKLGGGGVAV